MTHALIERPSFGNLNDAMSHWAVEYGNKPALTIIDGADRIALSYAQLHRRALGIAARLVAITRPGDRAMLVFDQGGDYLASFLGCSYARVVAVTGASPDEFRRQRRLVGMFRDSGAKLLLTSGNTCAKLQAVLADIGDDEVALLDVTDMDDAPLPAPLAVDGEDLMYLQYTSGSTSEPKGVMLTHRSVAANLQVIRRLSGQHRDSVHVSWLPLFHDMGLVFMSLSAFYGGCPLYLMTPAEFLRNPLRWLELISEVRGTMTAAPDFTYRLCVERATPERLAAIDLSSVELMVNGSEPVRVANVEAFYGAFKGTGLRREAMVAGYGMAEVAVCVTLGPALRKIRAFDARILEVGGAALQCERTAAHARLVCSCGPVDHNGYNIQIVDPQSLQAQKPGRVGEVWLSGASVGAGYWNNQAATCAAFDAHIAGQDETFLRTGDLGFSFGGQLYICGRLKEMMIVRGRNLFPDDVCSIVEQATDAMRGRRAAAFSIEGEDSEELVIACAARATMESGQAVAKQVSAEVTRQMGVTPAAILFVQNRTLERTTSGKVQHCAMRDVFLRGDLAVDSFVVNRSHSTFERLLGKQEGVVDASRPPLPIPDALPVWAVTTVCEASGKLLGGVSVGADDNLFEHGLDSLRAMQLLEALQSRLAGACTHLCLADLAELKTPREVARALLTRALAIGADAQRSYREVLV